jgi:hypothetical protein
MKRARARAAGRKRAAWLARRVRGQPRVYHLEPGCATSRYVPEQVTEATARKIARPCGRCAARPAQPMRAGNRTAG